MFPHRRALPLALITVLITLLNFLLAPVAQAESPVPSLYTITALTTPPPDSTAQSFSSSGADINDAGQIVGTTSVSGSATPGAFYYDNGQARTIGAGVFLLKINASGQAIGFQQTADGTTKAVSYAGNELVLLGSLPGEQNSRALGINDAGTIVGYAGQRTVINSSPYYSGTEYPVIFRDGAVEPLKWLSTDCGGRAQAINGPGQVFGVSHSCAHVASGTLVEFAASGTRAIRDEGSNPRAIGVNDRGDVLFQYSGGANRTSAIARDGGVLVLPFAAAAVDAADINNDGLVVGVVKDAMQRDDYGFVYSGGQLFNLNSLIPANSGWTIKAALGLNNRGQIVGYGIRGGISQAVLLTPRFTDLTPHNPYRDAILALAERGVIRGYDDGRFGLGDIALRAQSAAFIARSVGWDGEDWTDQDFPDQGSVDDDLWRNVRALAHYGVARGYDDGTYNPVGPVLHQQVALFVARAMIAKGYWVEQPDTAPYPNLPNTTERERADRRAVATYVAYAGAIPDRPIGQPWADWATPATRGWFAQVLWQAVVTVPTP